jgi:hypothetical protein
MRARRASESSRDINRRRSAARVTQLLQQWDQPSEPLSSDQLLLMREQLAREPSQEAAAPQLALPLSLPTSPE